MGDMLHLIIKKDYAASLIEHLKKKMLLRLLKKNQTTYPNGKRKQSARHWRTSRHFLNNYSHGIR